MNKRKIYPEWLKCVNKRKRNCISNMPLPIQKNYYKSVNFQVFQNPKKKLPTLECLLTKKALKPYDNKKMLVYQSKRHHKITPILILLYPSILQKSLTKISVAFFGPWFWLPPFLPNIQTFFILPGVLKQRFFVNSLLIPNVVLQQNKTLNKSRKLLHTQ